MFTFAETLISLALDQKQSPLDSAKWEVPGAAFSSAVLRKQTRLREVRS